MDISDLECGICCNMFSDNHCPMILPCSHTFCSCCVDGIISTDKNNCPVCRKSFKVTTATDLMVNRIALNMAKQFSSMHLGARTISKNPTMPFGGPNDSIEEVINDFKNNIMKGAIEDFQNTESQITGVLGILEEMKAEVIKTDKGIDRIMKELQEIKPLITQHLTNIRQSILMWKINLEVVQREKENIQKFEGKLDNCENFPSVEVVMGEVEDALQDSKKEISEFNRLLQKNERERHCLEKELLNAELRLKKVLEETAKTLDASPQDDVIMDDDLQSINGASEGIVQKEILIIKRFEGKQRVAPARKGQNNPLFVSHLMEGNVPQNCSIIEVDCLMEKSSRRAFLDLSSDDANLGRIIIKVIDEGNLALNFLHLCSGDHGPSYANSRVSDVWNKGGNGEHVIMGGYAVEGGTSRKAVVSGVHWGPELKREIYEETWWKAGQVWGHSSADTASMFYIVTRDDPSVELRGCFGMVEEGLDVLRDAISRYPHVTRIRIKDCGLVFSL